MTDVASTRGTRKAVIMMDTLSVTSWGSERAENPSIMHLDALKKKQTTFILKKLMEFWGSRLNKTGKQSKMDLFRSIKQCMNKD